MEIKGICPIAPAVYNADGEVNYDEYESCCAELIRRGAQALTLFGIAGEYYKMDYEEELGLIERTIRVCHANGVPAIVSNTRHSTEVAVKWAKHIEASGADCMMVLPPFFLKPGGAALFEHIDAVCSSVKIPVMFQYAPPDIRILPISRLNANRREPISPNSRRCCRKDAGSLSETPGFR